MADRRTKLLTVMAVLLLAIGRWHVPIADASPVDRDHDGIYDAQEGTGDADNDGAPNYVDAQ